MGSRLKKKKKLEQIQKDNQKPKSVINIIILLAYGYIAIITPNLKAYDSNGPKFLALSILNLLVWSFLIYKKGNYFSNDSLFKFFKTRIGLVYGFLILISLFSFVKSMNVLESIIPFFKIFTTFTAAWIITIILLTDKNSLKYLVIGMAGLLTFDALRVFSETYQYINGEITSISLIKAGYSNKNILAAALFIKLPFGLFLFTFYKGWLKKFGLFAVFVGSVAVLFMSARAFYLGLIFLSLLYSFFLTIRYFQTREKIFLKNTAVFIASLIFAFLAFTAIQSAVYPESQSGYNKSIAGRLSTVAAEDGGGGRLKYWRLTGEMIKENPLLGIGLGNWKIHVVEKENEFRGTFGSFYKVHNDFLEISAESGILAGVAFIFIFILVFFLFLKSIFKQKSDSEIMLFFLPAFGLFTYMFDAFFNFPHDRPEIQSLFALFLGISIAFSVNRLNDQKVTELSSVKDSKLPLTSKWIRPVQAIMFGITILAVYFLLLNFKSLKLQRIWKDERNTGKVQVTSDHFINNFPKIPTLGADGGEPVNMMIAKKLLQEKKYKEMQYYIHNNYPNPFDSKVEFFLGISHLSLNNSDSAIYYLEKAYYKKPYAYLYARQYCNLLETKGQQVEAIAVMDDFLVKDKEERDAWLYSASLNFKTGNTQKTAQIIDSAFVYFPKDTTVIRLKNYYSKNR